MRAAVVTFGVGVLLGASALAGEFIPGHVYVTVAEFDPCDFGGEEAILEIDPVTGETSIFADSSDGICGASGLAFTPDGAHLRLLNAGHLFPGEEGWLGWVQEFAGDGTSTIPLDASDGLQMPFGYNGLDFDEEGNFFVVNAFESTILRFPVDGGPGEVFADEDDGIYGRGAIDFDPISGDLFYTGDLADVILRITPAGDASVFDLPPNSEFLQTLAFDRVGNLFVAGFGHDGPHGSEYAVYRYDNADPGTRRLLVSGFTNPCCSASFPTALTVSPDDTQLYYAVGDVFAPGGFLYSIDPNDGSWVILADFSVFTDFFVMPTGIAVAPPDCNGNGVPDDLDITEGTSQDCTGNGIPDECEPDCNENAVADSCDIAAGTSEDCTADGIPDECEPDCNGNALADSCDIAAGTSQDCNANGVPDDCIELEEDCNANAVPDACDIAQGTSLDCNLNGIPDDCIELEEDCNANAVPDACDISQGTSQDCNSNGIPDECLELEEDCNANAIPDACDIGQGTSQDCNSNGIPDECIESEEDCNANAVPDACDISEESSQDCNSNGVPDECDLAQGTSEDCNENGAPDECDLDTTFISVSEELSPIGGDSPQSYTIPAAPVALGDITASFIAAADLGETSEWIEVDINGTRVGTIFRRGANNCPSTPDVDELLVSATTYNAAVNGNDAVIGLAPTDGVNEGGCNMGSYIIVSIQYQFAGQSADENENGVPDECENLPCEGDANGDGVVDPLDTGFVLARFGCLVGGGDSECDAADQNADGAVDPLDVGYVLARFGDCL